MQPWSKAAGCLALVVLAGCSPLSSPYSEQAYRNATTLKAKSIALVGQSTESYSSHAATAEALMVEISAAHEYARGYPRNQIVAEQWATMLAPDQGLMGEFVVTWKEAGRMGGFFAQEYAVEISDAFDTIICVEITKKAPSDCKPQKQE